jgi:hypothetical protein
MRIIGFNSGVLHHSITPISKEMLSIIRETGSNAIELGYSKTDRSNHLKNLKILDFRGFSHISIHAPSNFTYGNNKETIETLDLIQKAHNKFNFSCVVLHPDLVSDWRIFKNYNLPFAVENMDYRKKFGKTVEDLEKVFQNNHYGFVLDLNHAYSNDKTMKLASEFYEKFRDRLCEIHLSGFQKYHEPLFITKQDEIIRALPKKEVPIIIESVCDSKEDMDKELGYINGFFDKT